MNKAVMIPIQPKWSKMIKDGLKKFEFRNYAIPKGSKVYLYESLGRELKCHCCHEGQGKVVAEFVVGEVYETNLGKYRGLDIAYHSYVKLGILTNDKYREWGFANHSHAMEITDLIVYDEEWQCYIMEDSEFDDKYYADYWTKLEDAPTEPLDISEFIGWNKREKYPMGECGTKFSECYKCDMDNECSIQIDGREDCKLTHAPQGKVYVVEREN